MIKLLLLVIVFTGMIFGQCGAAGAFIINPITGLLDCTAVPGAGLGSVTSIDLVGTANQIIVTGASPITSSGTWTLSLPANTFYLPFTDAGALTADLAGAGAGNVNNGDHSYTVTFVSASGETAPINRTFVTVVDKTMDGKVAITAIPTGPTGTTSRKIYRSTANGGVLNSIWIPYLLTTIADNTTTVYTDNTADSGLGAQGSFLNSTGGAVKVNGTVEGSWTPYGLALGNLAIGDYFGGDRYVSPLYLSRVFTNISDDYPSGFFEVVHLNPGTGLGGGTASGWQLQLDTAVTSENITQAWGMALVLDHYGSGTIGDFSAIYINQDNLGGGTITRMRGIDITNVDISGGSTITNYASIEIGAVSTATGTVTANVGLKIGDQTGANITSGKAIVTGSGAILFGDLSSGTDSLPVCRHANGTLYSGTNTVGVLACP